MNKTVIVVIAVLALLGLSFGAYSLINKDSKGTNNSSNNSVDDSGSLADLFAQGADYNCSYRTSNTDEDVSEANVYISNGGEKYYLEIVSDDDGDEVTSYMIRDRDTVYTWVSSTNKGYKYTLEDSEEEFAPDSADFRAQNSGLETAFGYQYDCNPWIVQNSKFTPPTNIQFTDFDKLVEETTSKACDACNSLPEENREQCRTSLNCK